MATKTNRTLTGPWAVTRIYSVWAVYNRMDKSVLDREFKLFEKAWDYADKLNREG